MRLPRFRLRTLLISVAVIALVLGATMEVHNHRRWTEAASLERALRDVADGYDRVAAKQREWGNTRLAGRTAEVAAESRRYGESFGREKRWREHPWYRLLDDPGESDRCSRPGSASGP
jgi:hypothetical protein